MQVAFFGHRYTEPYIKIRLRETMLELKENNNISRCLVGNNGMFDSYAVGVLKELNMYYEQVLAYMPKNNIKSVDYSKTVYPDGLEKVPPKFAIAARNKWMVMQADIIVCYVVNEFGGAFTAVKYASNKGKRIINLADM